MSPCPSGNFLTKGFQDSFQAFHFSSPTWTSSRFGGIPLLGKRFFLGVEKKPGGLLGHPWSCVWVGCVDHEMMCSSRDDCHMSFKHGNFENEVQAWVNNVPLVTCHLFWVRGEAWWRHQWCELCHMLRQLAAELRLKYFASKKKLSRSYPWGVKDSFAFCMPKNCLSQTEVLLTPIIKFM